MTQLEVVKTEVHIGETYMIYGMITKIISQAENKVTIEINECIQAELIIIEKDQVEQLKRRAFEPAIFVSTVLSKEDTNIKVACNTVVFGQTSATYV